MVSLFTINHRKGKTIAVVRSPWDLTSDWEVPSVSHEPRLLAPPARPCSLFFPPSFWGSGTKRVGTLNAHTELASACHLGLRAVWKGGPTPLACGQAGAPVSAHRWPTVSTSGSSSCSSTTWSSASGSGGSSRRPGSCSSPTRRSGHCLPGSCGPPGAGRVGRAWRPGWVALGSGVRPVTCSRWRPGPVQV